MPDTPEGHEDAREIFEAGADVFFCPDYEESRYEVDARVKAPCVNREPMGDRRHNRCYACPTGYFLWSFDTEQELVDDTTRVRALTTRGF